MKRSYAHCGLAREAKRAYDKNAYHIENPDMAYEWCVYRHSEPLRRGEYQIEVKSDGLVTGCVCYRSRVVPRTVMKRRKGQSGGVL